MGRRTKEQRNHSGRNAFAKFTHGWGLLFLLVNLAFAGVLIYSDLLSDKFLILALAAIALVFVLVFLPLYFKNFKTSRRIIAFILSLIIGAGYCFGVAYLLGTLDFLKEITNLIRTETYYVVVRDDGVYENISDIVGETVHAYRHGDSFDKALDKLQDKVNCGIKEEENLYYMVDDLLMGETDVIFINAANYITLTDGEDSFDDYTRIIETIRLRFKTEDIARRVSVTKKPFNVYITGLDTEGTIEGDSRSDVNMVVTVNPVTKQVLLTSIPRDAYVELTDMPGNYDKLTHTGLYGADATVAAAEKLLGIEINYYVKVNYSTLVRLVNAIEGIDVFSDYEFTTNGQNWFYFEYGENHLNGAEALAFARERQAFEDGDFQRNRNQTKVMSAILKKVTTSGVLLTRYTTILEDLADYVEMNMTPGEIKALAKMQQEDMVSWTIGSQSMVGEVDYLPCYALGDEEASVVVISKSEIRDAVAAIEKIMDEGA